MIQVTIRKNGSVVATFSIPTTGYMTYAFDGSYVLESNGAYVAQPQYNYVPLQNDSGMSSAVDRMSHTITTLLDKVMSELQKERDFWRARAQALETENGLLRD